MLDAARGRCAYSPTVPRDQEEEPDLSEWASNGATSRRSKEMAPNTLRSFTQRHDRYGPGASGTLQGDAVARPYALYSYALLRRDKVTRTDIRRAGSDVQGSRQSA